MEVRAARTDSAVSRPTPGRRSLVPPPPVDRAVIRPSVIERLAHGSARVSVVAAPAGYGKTTHVAAWANAAEVPVAWMDLEPVDNDPAILLATLIEALCAVTDFDRDAVSVLHPTETQSTTLTAPEVGRAVARCTVPFALVFDDVHEVDSGGSVDLLDAVVANVPAGSRVVVVGRTVRLPSMARLRSGVGLTEIGQADLALNRSDAGALLESMGQVPGDDDEVARVLEETEGWPVGIRLSGLALLHGGGPAAMTADSLDSRDSNVEDYVRSEWLRGLDDDDVRFLAQVSCLDWLNGPLCDHVLDTLGSGKVLERIAANQLLVIPLDRRHESYRLHRLLRDVLHAELDRTDPLAGRRTHLRASEWFEQAGDIDRAVRHALHAPDLDLAERLVAEHAATVHTSGRFATLRRWIELFPQDRVRTSPSLCLLAGVVGLANDGPGVRAWTTLSERVLERSVGPQLDPEVASKILTFRSLITTGGAARARDDAAEAYRTLQPGIWHALAAEAYGAHAFALGELELAGELLAEGQHEALIFGGHTVEVICEAHLAIVARATGDTARAFDLARDARRRLHDYGLELWPTAMLVTGVSALVEALHGDPAKAHQDLLSTRQSVTMLEGVATWAHVQARLAMAETCLLLSDRVGAKTLLREVAHLVAGQPDATWLHVQLAELEDRVATIQSLPTMGPSSLSTAELRVLHYLPTNLTIGEIGERLYVSRHTTKSHVASIYRKLGTSSRRETVDIGRASGLLPPA